MKLLIRILSVCFGLLWAAAGAWAQSAGTANATPLAQGSGGAELYLRDLPQNLHPSRPSPLNADNIVMLTQVGSSNVASLSQLGDANQVISIPCRRMNVHSARAFGARRVKVATDGEICWLSMPLEFAVSPEPLWLIRPDTPAPERAAP